MMSLTISDIAAEYGLNEEERKEFYDNVHNYFADCEEIREHDLTFLERWREIYAYAEKNSAAEAINKYVSPKRTVNFKQPDKVKMEIYDSFAGEIPIIYLENADDFEQLVTNTVYKGIRPDDLSKTGASFAFGRSTRFIMLSAKPYSNVPASEMGLDEQVWADRSMIIRREHECTHYFTKQVFGISRNSIHDEIMADFFGIYEAFGYYKAEYFLRFMGISGTSGGRLDFYTNDLSQNVKKAVSKTAETAASYLEKWSASEEFSRMTREQRIRLLCKTGLEGMCENA